MRRRNLLFSLGALAAAPWLAGCARKDTLVVGIHPWIGYETLYLAANFHWLPGSIRLHQSGAASDLLAALRAGVLDAACLTLDETLRARAEGLPLSIALVFDVSAGADAVLARPGIRSLAELAGKRLGVEQSALGALMLSKVLEAAGLRRSDLRVVDLPMDQQVAAWQRQEVDAVICFEPTSTVLLRAGAQVLFDSRQIPETIFDVLAVRRDRARSRRGTLKALVAGHFRALGHIQTNHQDAIYRIATRQGVQPQEVQRALGGVLLPSLPGNLAYLSGTEPGLLGAARTVSDLLLRNGVIQQGDSLGDLITPEWLPRDGE